MAELMADLALPRAERRRSMIRLQAVAFGLGLCLLVFVINRVGMQPIFDALRRVGFGFFLLLAISGCRHVLRTLAMSLAVPAEHRRFSFLQAFGARLGGEVISFLTFAGPLLGEATKVALLRKRLPFVYGVSALVIDNLLYYLSVVLFVLSGACVLLYSYKLPLIAEYVVWAIAAASVISICSATLAANGRFLLLPWIIEKIKFLNIKANWLVSRREQLNLLESNVHQFFKHRPSAFFAILGLDFLSHATGVVEVYITLQMLGFRSQVQPAFVIESLTKVINFVFGFVPATIGVYEGGTEVILRSLGFAAAAGVALALVRKASILFWTFIGLLVLIWRALPNAFARVMNKSPRLQKIMDSLVLSNVAHRPIRTAVSVLGIAVGVLLIIFTVGLAHGMLNARAAREANIGAEIMIQAGGTFGFSGSQPFSLPVSRAQNIATISGVRAAVPIGQRLDKSDTGFGSRVVDGIPFDEYAALAGLAIKEGRKLVSGDEAIVDTVWQSEHTEKQYQPTVGATLELFERPFKIVGIYGPPGGARIKIPLATLQEHVGSVNRCTAVLIACENPAEQETVAGRIRERFPDDQIIFTRDLPELYTQGLPALNIFLNVVVAIASAISLLVILLAMYTTVTERTRQIGILKSLGMSKTTIAWVIEQEAIMVSVLGVILGVVLTLALRLAVMRTTSLTIEIEPRWIGISLAVGLLGGTIGALYPALRAARQDAVEALSYE